MKRLLFFLMATIFAMQGFSQATLNESFDGTLFPPDDWTRVNTLGSTTVWTRTVAYYHTGVASAYVNYNTSGTENYLITPKLVINSTDDSISFWARMDYLDATYNQTFIRILVSTTDNTVSSFSTIPLLAASPSYPAGATQINDTWKKFTVSLGDYVGQEIYVAIKQNDNDGYGVYIDDVQGPELFVPTCPKPTALIASNPTTIGIDLGWTDDAGSIWNIQYMLATETDWANATTVSGVMNPHTFSDLSASTTYKVRVQSDCGAEQSEWSAIKTFSTACDAITTLPYSESFDSYGTVVGSYPPCWGRPVLNTTTPWPSINTSYNHTPPASIKFQSAAATTPTYVITPPFSDDINTLRVKFWLKSESTTSSGTMQVGVMSDPTDLTTFELLATIAPTTTNWTQYEFALNSTTLTGSNNCIAFKHVTVSSAYYYWLDDVIVDYIPSCFKPSAVVVSNLTVNTADVSWTPANANDAAWWLYYKEGSSQYYDSVYVSGIPSHSFTGINPSSSYSIYVKTDCGQEVSDPTTVQVFFTPCAPIANLPWSEGFEALTAVNTLPPCWTAAGLGTSTGTQMTNYNSYNRNARTGTGAAWYRYGSNDSFTTPPFELTENTYYDFSFWYVTDGLSGWTSLKAQLWDATANTLVGTIGTQINTPINTTYQLYTSSFTIPDETHTYKIAIQLASTSSPWYLTIDDISLELTPACPNVNGLTVGAASTTSVSVNWTDEADTGDGYNIAYASNLTTPFDPTTATIIPVATGTTLPYIIPGFNPGDSVWIAVQRGCLGNWTAVKKVILPAAANLLPFSYDFEDPTTYNTWTLYNGTQTNKWYIGAPGGNGTGNGLFISNNNGTSANYASPVAIVMAATLVEFDNSPEFALAFDWKATGESSYDYIYAYVIPIGVPIVAGTLPSDTYRVTPAYLNLQSTWQRKTISLGSQYSNTIQQIVFAWKNDGSGDYQPPASIDNIEIVGIVCPSTTNLVASNITGVSANIAWQSNEASVTDWWIFWKTQSATAWVDSLNINTNPYTLTGLIANTPYQVKIVNNCGTELSYPMSILNFRTACDAITTLPYVENFDTYGGTGTAIFPACWNRMSNYSTNYPYISSTTFGGSAGSLYFWSGAATNSIAVAPPIDPLIDISTLMVGFKIYSSSIYAGGFITVGVMTDPLDSTTFVPVGLVQNITATSQWEDKEVSLSSYTGTGRYIALKCGNFSGGGYLDNFMIDYIPACARPTALAVASVTAIDANITFIPGNVGDTQWKIYYRATGSSTWMDDDVYNIPYQMTGLTANTPYQVYITTLCGDGSYSNASSILNFRTSCDAIAVLPFTENFDTYGTGTTIMPACWVRTTTYADRPYVTTGGRTANCLYFYAGTAGTYNIAAMPPIDATIPINTLMATFYYKYSSATDRMVVGVMTDPSNASTFDSITTITGTSTWAEYQVNFNAYTGTGQYIAFKTSYNTTYCYGYIDDLTIDLIPACARPTNITATNITLSTADIGFTPGNATDTQWKVHYKPFASTTWTDADVYAIPYQMTGLTASTTYQVYVTTLCADGSYSNPSVINNFNTACDEVTTFPWTETFDALNAGEFPACWFRPVIYSTYPKVSTASTRVHSTPASLEIHSAVGAPTYAITPQLGADINSLKVTFWAMAESTTSSGTIEVGVMSDPMVLSSFESVQIIQPTTTSYTQYTVTFATTTLTGSNNYIAFRQNTVSAIYYYWIDDIVVDYINPNPCPAPTNITVVPSNTSATVTWTAGGSESSWEVRLGTTGTVNTVSVTNYILQGLTPSTAYTVYVRANCGTGYSSWIPKQFTTTSVPSAPTVTTNVPTTQIAQTTALFTGTYVQSSDTIQTKGFEYKTNAATVWIDQVVTTGTTPFTYAAAGLSANTGYSVKAYVTTATFGKTYGNTVTFTTLAIVPPTVTTDSVRNITQTSAMFYGKITQNTEPIEARGFEYKLSTETWANAINISATGVTSITASPTTLTQGMTYNVRAYGRTITGPTYGQELTFKTLEAPSVETITLGTGDIQDKTATLRGKVLSAGNALASQVEVGFVYSTATNPTIGAIGTTKTESTYSITDPNFLKGITALHSNTPYFFKAYIINPVQTSYGNEVSFTTLGLNDATGQEISIMMYPNPATSQTKLIVSGINGETKIVLSDVQGRILNTINAKAVSGTIEQTIDLNNLAKGVYYIRIQNSDISRTQKLIVK